MAGTVQNAIDKLAAVQSILDERQEDIKGDIHLALCNAQKEVYDAVKAIQGETGSSNTDRQGQLERLMRSGLITWPELGAMLSGHESEIAYDVVHQLLVSDVTWREAAARHPVIVECLVGRMNVVELDDYDKCQQALHTLTWMATDCDAAKRAIMDDAHGIVPMLHSLLDENGGGNSHVNFVGMLISELACGMPEARVKLGDSDMIPVLVNALRHEDSLVMDRDTVCAALAQLIEENPANQTKLVDAGALPAVVAFLPECRAGDGEDAYDYGAMRLLANLVENNASYRALVLSLKAHEKLIELFEDVPDFHKEVVLRCLTGLASEYTNTVPLYDAGVLSVVESVLTRHAECIRLTGRVCILVRDLTEKAPMCLVLSLCVSGIPKGLVDLLKNRFLGPVASLVHFALQDLCNLAYDPLRQKLLDVGVPAAFEATLKDPSRGDCHKLARQGLAMLRGEPDPSKAGGRPKRARRA